MQKAFKTSLAFFIITQKSNIVFHPYVCYHVCQKLKLVVGWNIITKNIDITHLRASITPLNTCWLRKKNDYLTIHLFSNPHHVNITTSSLSKKNYEHNTRSIYEKQRSKEYMHFLKNPHYRMIWLCHHIPRRRNWRPEWLQHAFYQRQ